MPCAWHGSHRQSPKAFHVTTGCSLLSSARHLSHPLLVFILEPLAKPQAEPRSVAHYTSKNAVGIIKRI